MPEDDVQSTMKVQPLGMPPQQPGPGQAPGQAPPPAKKAVPWRMILLGLVFIGGGAFFLAGMLKGRTEISWNCGMSPSSVSCNFSADKGKGSVCFDLVATCSDGEHRSHVCSKKIDKGATDKVEVQAASFKPPFTPAADCKISFENKKIN